MRTKITLACTECKQRNYNTTKDKKTHPDRMETKKYCRFCKTHTMHKVTKYSGHLGCLAARVRLSGLARRRGAACDAQKRGNNGRFRRKDRKTQVF